MSRSGLGAAVLVRQRDTLLPQRVRGPSPWARKRPVRGGDAQPEPEPEPGPEPEKASPGTESEQVPDVHTRLYDAAWRRSEGQQGVGAVTAAEAAGHALARLCEPWLRTLSEETGRTQLEAMAQAHSSCQERLGKELRAARRQVGRKIADEDTAEAVAKVLEESVVSTLPSLVRELHAVCEASASELNARLEKEHRMVVSTLRGQSGLLIAELVDEAKDGLQKRHGWKAAEVARKLEAAHMAAHSRARAEFQAELEELRRRDSAAAEAAEQQERAQAERARAEALEAARSELEALLTQERERSRELEGRCAEHEGLHAEVEGLRRRLREEQAVRAAAQGQVQSVEHILGGGGSGGGSGRDEGRARRQQDGALAAARSLQAREAARAQEMQRQLQRQIDAQAAEMAALRLRLREAEAARQRSEAASAAAQAALAQERCRSRRGGSAGGASNPNSPAGLSIGRRPRTHSPLFRSSLTASDNRQPPKMLAELGPGGSILYRVCSQAGVTSWGD